MLPTEAAKMANSFLEVGINGEVRLKETHNYYFQVQGQMYVAGLQWVDFVVWFGADCDIFLQRIQFDDVSWYSHHLPALNHFYRSAFLPELLTGRVKRGVKLYNHGGWKPYSK